MVFDKKDKKVVASADKAELSKKALKSLPEMKKPDKCITNYRDTKSDAAPSLGYEKRLWKGIITVYRCHTCGMYMDNKDDMILHCVSHASENEKENELERMIKND